MAQKGSDGLGEYKPYVKNRAISLQYRPKRLTLYRFAQSDA
ncbi:hypothetical protein C2W63_02506 [Bacillus velezensis]|nr:hypothetical protein C2W63_02506 [Bacillus velezensis]